MSNSTWLDTYSSTVDKLLFKIEQIKMKGTFQDPDLNLNEIASIIKGLRTECINLANKVHID